MLRKGFVPPGKHLLIKIALRQSKGIFLDTFTVRYDWTDVLRFAKEHAPPDKLSRLARVESIWPEYWSVLCKNGAPRELFSAGGAPESPEDIENPARKTLRCVRR